MARKIQRKAPSMRQKGKKVKVVAPLPSEAGTFALFTASFGSLLQRRTLLLLFADLLFWGLAFAGMTLYPTIMERVAAPFEAAALELPDQLDAESVAQLSAGEDLAGRLLLIAALITIGLALYLFFAWALTRGMIWRILRGKIADRFWVRFIGISMVWYIILAAVWAIALLAVKQLVPYQSLLYPGNALWLLGSLTVLLIISWYFTELFHYRMAVPEWRAIWGTMVFGIAQFRKLAPAYGLALLTFCVLWAASFAIRFLPVPVQNPLAAAMLLCYCCWMRCYLASVFAQGART